MGDTKFLIAFSETAVEDLEFFEKSGQHILVKKIKKLIESIKEDPVRGIGKPEQLKHNFAGLYSRRINDEHRIIYEVIDDVVYIESMKGHYGQR